MANLKEEIASGPLGVCNRYHVPDNCYVAETVKVAVHAGKYGT
jgi:hypothetical protein